MILNSFIKLHMRKSNLISVFILFLLVPASITSAQTISSQKGLTTAVFPTQYGNVKVFVPDDVRPGDVISGTVIAEPKGNNVRQTEKNLAELVKFSVSIDGNKYAVPERSTSFKWLVALDRQVSSPIELIHVSGYKAGQLTLQFQRLDNMDNRQPFTKGCAIPSHSLIEAPVQIKGSFDGDASNTKCTLNGQPMVSLAESPRQCQVQYPQNGQGIQTMQVNENGKQLCAKQVSGVQLNVVAGKLDLRKGENTYVDVTITGLQGIKDTCTLTIINNTPVVVTMSPSNNVIIMLIPDSVSSGTFNRRFNITSNRTGGFIVNVDLSIPEYFENPFPVDNPEKVCNCSVTASIVKRTTINPRPTFAALVQKSCTGPAGQCGAGTVTHSWDIAAGKENADIADENHTKSFVTIQPKNAGKFILKLTAVNTCADGTTCTDVKYCNENGEEVPVPDAGDEQGKTLSQPGEKKDQQQKNCKCDAKVSIIEGADRGTEMDFTAEPVAECTGVYGKGVNSFVVCDVLKKTFSWFIKDGKEDAAIKGDASAQSVTVTRKTGKAFTLAVKLIVECLDGTKCEAEDEVKVPEKTPEVANCSFSMRHSDPAKMDGGLMEKYLVSGMKIKRDDFVALGAEGADYDLVTLMCLRQDPCKDVSETKQYVLNGRVRFEWHIINGDGRFVLLGSLPAALMAFGDQAIFMPPVLPFPEKGGDTTHVTNILLHVIDDNPGQPQDAKQNRIVSITIKRKKTDPDYYIVDVTSKDKYKLPTVPKTTDAPGSCNIIPKKSWEPDTDLAKPIIELPGVEGNSTIINGQWLILKVANKEDKDKLRASCKSSSTPPCIVSGAINRNYSDNIAYKWWVKEGEGKFITGNGNNFSNTVATTGGYVLYEAPSNLNGKNSMSITINCKPLNPDGGVRNDGDIAAGTLSFTVYQGGIKIAPADITWLPEEKNNVMLKSSLNYPTVAGGITVWNPAPAHFKRIHFFELFKVSNEKGICMNDPLPDKAKKTRDLLLKPEDGKEVFDDEFTKEKPENKDYFLQAKTVTPLTETSLTVYSEDYGSYGFLRSFANTYNKTGGKPATEKPNPGNKRSTDEPIYISVPLTQPEAQHPSLTMGRGKFDHPDNRVSIPRDVDENRIADNGWMNREGTKLLPDPPFMKNDDDNLPEGDKVNGDGLTNYEEYRGFMYLKATTVKTGTEVVMMDKPTHVRTNHEIKTVFVRNNDPDVLKTDLYKEISGLEVIDINAVQYFSDEIRIVNFNYNTVDAHLVDQLGLHLRNGGLHSGLLGIANTKTKDPARPNDVIDVVVYRDKVQKHVDEINAKVDKFNADAEARKKKPGGYKHLIMKEKMAAVVAHELLHANGVWHHGEGDEKLDVSHDAMNGLRSGDTSCVMRYDNTGTLIKDTTYFPEAPGTKICTTHLGNSYNKPVEIPKGKKKTEMVERGYGNCAPGRGNCTNQIHITGFGPRPVRPKPK
jgi:hypothetical protein